jgi:hypothetical protein
MTSTSVSRDGNAATSSGDTRSAVVSDSFTVLSA